MEKKRKTKQDIHVPKPLPITYGEVAEAYKRAKSGGEAAGVDKERWKDFDNNIEGNLYQLWNRLASGTYFPQAVRLKLIPSNGKTRKLGIPTLRDRIAQHVLKMHLEPKIEPIFSNSSYGYRPKRNCHQALEVVRSNCFTYDWVVDIDISKFFDEIDHELLMTAVAKESSINNILKLGLIRCNNIIPFPMKVTSSYIHFCFFFLRYLYSC